MCNLLHVKRLLIERTIYLLLIVFLNVLCTNLLDQNVSSCIMYLSEKLSLYCMDVSACIFQVSHSTLFPYLYSSYIGSVLL